MDDFKPIHPLAVSRVKSLTYGTFAEKQFAIKAMRRQDLMGIKEYGMPLHLDSPVNGSTESVFETADNLHYLQLEILRVMVEMSEVYKMDASDDKKESLSDVLVKRLALLDKALNFQFRTMRALKEYRELSRYPPLFSSEPVE